MMSISSPVCSARRGLRGLGVGEWKRLFPLLALTVAAAEDLTSLSDLELARRLPPVHSERVWLADGSGLVGYGVLVLRPEAQEMQRRLDQKRDLEDAVWREALERCGAIKMRRRWLAGRPLAVSIEIPRWLGDARLSVSPVTAGLHAAVATRSPKCFNAEVAEREANFHQELGELAPGEHTIEVICRVEQGTLGNYRQAWTGRLRFPVTVVETMDEAVPPVSNAALEEAVVDSLFVDDEAWLSIDPDVVRHHELATTGLSLLVEVLHNGEAIGSVPLLAGRANWWNVAVSSHHLGQLALFDSDQLPGVPSTPLDAKFGAEWSLRIRGVSAGLLKLWDATQRWEGEVLIPLDSVRRDVQSIMTIGDPISGHPKDSGAKKSFR